MTNPYSALGIDRSATDEQVKNAYKALAQKYSPENYIDNPLADLAAGKMEEINAAYDQIMAERRVGNSKASGSSGNYGNNSSNYSSYSSPELQKAKRYYNVGDINNAENVLFDIPSSQRNAEWNHLMGLCCYSKGWLTEALKYFENAVAMEPGNSEYQTSLRNAKLARNNSNNMNGNPYNRGYSVNQGNSGCCCDGMSGCDMCSSMICADCCCECIGGDFIRCI